MPFDPLGHDTPQEDKHALAGLATMHANVLAWQGRVTDTVAVEIGSWVGATAIIIEQFFSYLFCVDTFEGNPGDKLDLVARRHGSRKVFETFCRNIGDRLGKSIFPCVGTSELWASVWCRPIDFLFIDARHDYNSVLQDIRLWSPLVRPDGIICGHDYGLYPGVTEAVRKSFDDFQVEHTVWWTKKPKAALKQTNKSR